MAYTSRLVRHHHRVHERNLDELVTISENGRWLLRLPPNLKDSQQELEKLLTKVFADRPICENNLALAQQMSLNWCQSKCKQAGLELSDCF